MVQESEALAGAIGARVRSERVARQWTLDELSEASGVSRRALINVEQGSANPNVGTLLKLGEALGIGLPSLVAPPREAAIEVTRGDHAPPLWRGDHGGVGALMTSAPGPDVLELWDWTLGPGDVHDSDAHPPGTRELIHVHSGSLVVTAGDHREVLHAGDAASFPGDVPHGYGNLTEASARFSLTVLEPGPTRTGTGHAARVESTRPARPHPAAGRGTR